jgi:RHS repeat-associated protein
MKNFFKYLLRVASLCLIPVSVSLAQSNQVPDETELMVLKNIYDSLGGQNWTTKTNWPTTWPSSATSAQFGTWHGVIVSGGDIIRVALNENNLVGVLPSSISKLTKLTSLNMRVNQISGSIPPSYTTLPALNVLILDFNLLSGSIPANIGSLTQLTKLNVGNNALTGSIPSSIGSLTSLTEFSVSYNQLSGEVPSTISNLIHLESLYLRNNAFTGTILSSLTGLTALRYLYLSQNQFEGSFPLASSALSSMVIMEISKNNFSGNLPDLTTWTNLAELRLATNKFSGDFPKSIGGCTALTKMYIENNDFRSLPSELLSLPLLTTLNASNNLINKIPLFENHVNKANLTLTLSSNMLDFAQLESLYQKGIFSVAYATQKSFDDVIYVSLKAGETLVIPARNPGANGSISWERRVDGSSSWVVENTINEDLSQKTFKMSNFSDTQDGRFQFKLTNSLFPGVTLKSEIIAVRVGNPLVWNSEVGVADLNGNLNKTGIGAWDIAGAVSENVLDANIDGNMEFAANANSTASSFVIGFSPLNTSVTRQNISYGLELGVGQRLFAYESSSTGIDVTSWTAGDIFRISKEGSNIKYYKNGTVVRTVSVNPAVQYAGKIVLHHGISPGCNSSFWIPSSRGTIPDAWEYAALRDVYDSLGGAAWKVKTNWTNSQTINVSISQLTNWYGLSVSNGDVATLQLPSNNLVGRIPTKIGNLKKMTILRLHINFIEGSIPSTIGGLSSLTYLNLASNPLTGSIPTSIGNLAELYWIGLYRTGLTGDLPPGIFSLPKLTHLYIYYTGVSGSLPATINLPKIQLIYLYQNNLTGGIPAALTGSSTLTNLALEHNPELGGPLPETIGQLVNLTELWLNGNGHTGTLPSSLGSLTKLKILNLWENQFSGPIPASLSALTQLDWAAFNSNNLSGDIPNIFAGMTNLDSLWLGSNNFTGNLPPSLENIKTLALLNASDNNLSGNLPEWIGTLPLMKTLSLGNNSFSGEIPSSWQNLNLKQLYLDSTNVTGPLPDWLPGKTSLKILDVTGSRFTRLPAGFKSRVDASTFTLGVSGNQIPVADLEANLTGPDAFNFKDFTFELQAYTPDVGPFEITLGTQLELTAIDGGVHGVYVWQKLNNSEWQDINSLNESSSPRIFRVDEMKPSDAGSYRYTVTNTWISEFEYTSPEIQVNLKRVTVLEDLIFQYKYDHRNRVVGSKVPGAQWQYMVYDERDRRVFTQDGNQRENNQWSYTKYDFQNRPIISGIYTHSGPLDVQGMRDLLSTTIFYETRDNNAPHGYTNAVFSNPAFVQANFEVLTVMYYDDYSHKPLIKKTDGSTDDRFDYNDQEIDKQYKFGGEQQPVAYPKVIGLNTGTKVKVLGENRYLWTVGYYDDKFRVVQTVSSGTTTDMADPVERSTNLYDFVGKMMETKTRNFQDKTTARKFNYDHQGRLLKTWHKVDNQNWTLLAMNEYNELGQLIDKKLHNTDAETVADASRSFKQSVDYQYTIRGWLANVNDMAASEPADLFSMTLNYNQPTVNGGRAQYNGNISEVLWRGPDAQSQSYGYSYDAMNRLTEAKYYNADHPLRNNRFNETIWDVANNKSGYDLNGNIKFLRRNGRTGMSPAGVTLYNGAMDNLSYSYLGNQLLKVTDAAVTTEGFKDASNFDNDYAYDANGNMYQDKNNQINGASTANGNSEIIYNSLNLVDKVTKSNGEWLKYSYDATGRKLSQTLYSAQNQVVKKSDYAGDFFYENNVLQFINHDEGRVVMTGSTPEYQYFLTDHLGNVRVTFTSKQETTSVTATMEPDQQSDEALAFERYDKIRIVKDNTLFDHTNGSSPGSAMRLSGGPNERTGLVRTLSVMPGDVVNMEVWAKYLDKEQTNWEPLLAAMIAPIAAGNPGVVFDGGSYNTNSSNPFPYAGMNNTDESSGDGPKAYLNFIMFDRDFNPILPTDDPTQTNYVRVPASAKESGENLDSDPDGVSHQSLSASVTVKQAGYLYIYLSNEEETPVEVYFDDFKVEVIESPVVQMDDYYPFGLAFNSFSRENSVKQEYEYNGKELQDELNLGWLDYGARMYMPETGRWGVVDPLAGLSRRWSPYTYAYDNPIRFIDPDGMMTEEFQQSDLEWGRSQLTFCDQCGIAKNSTTTKAYTTNIDPDPPSSGGGRGGAGAKLDAEAGVTDEITGKSINTVFESGAQFLSYLTTRFQSQLRQLKRAVKEFHLFADLPYGVDGATEWKRNGDVHIYISASTMFNSELLYQTIGHELQHAIDYANGNFMAWSEALDDEFDFYDSNPNDGKSGTRYVLDLIMEARAYKWNVDTAKKLGISSFDAEKKFEYYYGELKDLGLTYYLQWKNVGQTR